MARKDRYGRFMLSAGEIGSYAVCPESWRLRAVAKVSGEHNESKELGAELHKRWADELERLFAISKAIKVIIFLIALALGVELLLQSVL